MNNPSPRSHRNRGEVEIPAKLLPVIILVVGLLALASCCFKTVPAGHVGVASLFGDVKEKPYPAGLHFPVNPLLKWVDFDARQKTHKETAAVPSQDQLLTDVDVSVQYRLIAAKAPLVFSDTGSAEQAVEVHLIPALRSLIREQGKTIENAQDFFNEETQQRLQENLYEGMKTFLEPMGILVSDVLIRDIQLPAQLRQRIEEKKAEEQELARTEFEQQRKVVQAKAEREAAEQEAEMRRTLADAQAYEIEQINKAVSENPAYIKLQALEALKAISKDPASKMYFMDGDAPMPLPLMNLSQ